MSLTPLLPTRLAVAGAVLALGLGLGHGPARGQDAEDSVDFEMDRSSFHSPQSWAIELRGGPYRPDVDSEFGGLPADQRPHQAYFGKDRRVMYGIEGDFQFFDKAGTLAVGLGVSRLIEKANAFVEPGAGNATTLRSTDATEFSLIPVALSLVYRFDLMAKRASIPIVPYAKAGLDWVYWSITDGNGHISDPDGSARGRGTTLGWHAAAGVSVMLDVIDPAAAQALDAEIGVNHTHIFVELGHYDISGLGQSGKMHLGDTTWSAGLLFEF